MEKEPLPDTNSLRTGNLIPMDKEILAYFDKKPAIEKFARKELICAILKKHSTQLSPLKKEGRELKKLVEELEKKREDARRERDRANQDVATHKEQRQKYHQQANEKRREFFVLLDKLDDLEKLDGEMEGYQDHLEKLEWELQTTAVTASDEKAMIKKMRGIYSKLTEANKEAQEKLGIEEKLPAITGEIGTLLGEAQSHHQELLTKAEESEKHHALFTETGKNLSTARIRLRRLERKIGIHNECKKYWSEWVGDAHD